MLRISAGQFKGSPLVTPTRLRATETKVRQALFNILGSFIEHARVLDGFAGSGSLGVEALSRGAAFVAFVESDTEAILSIRDNLDRLGAQLPRHAWRVLHLEVERALRQLAREQQQFEVILLDPPYRTDDGKKALNVLVDCAILAPAGLVVMEHHRQTALPVAVGPLRASQQHRYGDTVLSFYQGT